MTSKTIKRIAIGLAAFVIVIGAGAVIGLHYATKLLKNQVIAALGAESEVGDIIVGWSAIEVRDIRIHAPRGWPAADTLRAKRVVITPDLRELISSKIHIQRIRVEDAYLSVLRTRDSRLRLLPSMLEREPKPETAGAPATSAPPVSISTIELHDSAIELFDASVKQPAHKVRLEQLKATVEDLHVPDLAGRTKLKLDGVVKGVQHDGTFSVSGWAEIASRDSDIKTTLRGVDLVALQPYLIKASETGVRRGTLDLDLQSTVKQNRLHAPGAITLTGLELAPAPGGFGTFMGMPRQAVLASLKNRNDQIKIQFTLEGNLNDPHFSLNENFSKRLGSSIAQGLGISFEGLSKGVGSAADGLGSAVKKLFGK